MTRGMLAAATIMMLTTPAAAQQAVLDRLIAPDALGDPVVWVPSSIHNGMFAARIAMAGQVPLVFEAMPVALPSAVGPTRVVLTGKTVREALDLFVANDPRYMWTEVTGVIVVRPLPAISDSSDPLNLPIANVAWSEITVPQALSGVATLLAGGTGMPNPSETPFDDRVFSISVASGSVLDVLVELARRHGRLVWSLPDTTQHPGHAGLSVGVTNFSGRGISADVPPSQ
jgi:hypothetical protein